MDNPRHCAQCGAGLSVYALEGMCGNCLLGPGLEPMLEPLAQTDVSKCSGETKEIGRFGDYELLEEIARGGMGVVYRARQVSLDRIVAVKMLLAGPLAGKDFVQRFRTEAAAAASLQHPNIVAIHEVGFAEGQHFFAMDYVEGLTLARLVAKGPLPARQAATYLKTIAEAIHFAHERKVLHRDLKPSNVLIDSATNQPRVTDFGLAKRLDAETELTLSGQLLGSPNYMSPEQATAKRGTVGRRSDVYSLGAILYHLLTGRPPFQGETLTDVLRQLADTDPLAPHLLTPRVAHDLETICVKCLEKEPAKRYQSAQDLADELDRFLRDEPIQARPIRRAQRAWRWCRRKPVVAGLGVALVLAIIIGFAGTLWQWRHAAHSAQAEAEQRQRADRNLYTADMSLAHQAWKEGNLQSAQELLHAHRPQRDQDDLRGFEWRYLWTLCQDESRFTFTNVHFAGDRRGLALAANGRTVIAASGDSLKWLDGQKHREVQTVMVGTNAINGLFMAMDQPGLVAYRTDRVKALSLTGEALLGGGLDPGLGGGPIRYDDGAFALSWGGTLLAASGTNSTVQTIGVCTVGVFDVKTGKQLGPGFNLGGDENINSLAFSPDGTYLACGTLGTKIHILKVPSLRPVNVLTGHTASVNCLAFDRTGSKLVSGGGDSHIRVWSVPDGALVADLTGHQGAISDLAFSPDGLRLASAGSDHTVRLWNLARPEIPPTFLHGHRGAVSSVLFSRDGSELYSGSDDGTVKVWDASAQESTNILHHPDWTDEASFSPDGTFLAVTHYNAHTAVLWDVESRSRIGTVGHHSAACRGVKFSPDGKLLATAGNDNSVQISDSSSQKQIFDLPTSDVAGCATLAFHPLKAILATATKDLRFWDLRNGKPINLLPDAPAEGVNSVAFSPEGRWLALGMQNGQVSLWDSDTGRLSSPPFYEHTNAINVLCFSHDGNILALGGEGTRIALYDVRQRRMIAHLDGHKSTVCGLAFPPDDKTLVSASYDGTIRFWSMANGQVALTLGHDGAPVTSVAFSLDGNLMVTSGADGTARLWPAARFEDIAASEKAKENRK